MRVRGLLAVMVLAFAISVPGANAQEAVEITTDYPAVAVEPGEQATFNLTVNAPGRQRVDLAVTEVPEGWAATLRGGGFVIDGVYSDPDEPPAITLDVDVPTDVDQGSYRLTVTATAGGATVALPLDLRVEQEVAGNVELNAEFPSLSDDANSTFDFNVELVNNTPAETTFSLDAVGPEGWLVDARPASEPLASTATVAGGETASVTVNVDPPDDTPAGVYEVLVTAAGAGQTVETSLEIEITGNYAMRLTTPDERLNAEVTAGGAREVPLVLVNEGTAPLIGATLTATPPTNWEVTFAPETVDVAPGEAVDVVATITPSGDAVAGDYVVTLEARVEQTSSSVDLRTTVETSRVWGLVGIALILGALIGLGYVFRRYGRR